MARMSLLSMAVGAGIGAVVARSMSKRQDSEEKGKTSRGLEHLITHSLQEEKY